MSKFLLDAPAPGTVKILDTQSQDCLDIGPRTPVLVLLEGDARTTLQGDKPEHILAAHPGAQFASLTAEGWRRQYPAHPAYVRDEHLDLWWLSHLEIPSWAFSQAESWAP